MLEGRYQESSSHNTCQFHFNRDTGEKREEVEAPFEEAGPRESTSKERDICGSGKQFPRKANGKVPGNAASLRQEVTHIAPICQMIKEEWRNHEKVSCWRNATVSGWGGWGWGSEYNG